MVSIRMGLIRLKRKLESKYFNFPTGGKFLVVSVLQTDFCQREERPKETCTGSH
jgi:hypothetical protein